MQKRATKLKIQQKQTRYMLIDFNQLLGKCIRFTRDLEVDFPKKKQYQDFERKSKLKINLLDVTSLLALKEDIKKKHQQLITIEHQLSYEHSMKMKKKDYFKPTLLENIKQSPENTKQQTSLLIPSERSNNMPMLVKNISRTEVQRPQSFLPMYFIRNDTTQNKLDSISKFIAQLKRSMKKQTQTSQEMKIENFLMMEPEYLKLKEQLERYKMHHQQFMSTFNQRVQSEASKYIENCEVVQETSQYKTIKIYKQDKRSAATKIQSQKNDTQQEEENRILDQLGITQQVQNEDKQLMDELKKKVEADFAQMMKSIQQDAGKSEEVFQRGGQSIVNIQANLKMMRANRKKKFMDDDDIWNQISKN